MNKEDRAVYFLAHIDNALLGEAMEIHRQEASLSHLLADVRALGELHVPEPVRANWNARWEQLEEAMIAVHSATTDTRQRIERGTLEGMPTADSLRKNLVKSLAEARELRASALPAEEHEHWDDLWQLIDSKVKSIQAHAATLDLQITLRGKYNAHSSLKSKEILNRLSKPASMVEVEKFGEEYRHAADDLHRERERSGDAADVLKSMFMYIETPDERVRLKHRAEAEEMEKASSS